MFEESDMQEPVMQILATEQMIKLMLESVTLKLDQWPGGDPSEQEALIYLKNTLFAASMELLLDRS